LITNIFLRQRDLAAPLGYCIGTLGSNGCEQQLDFAGSPSASNGSGFTVSVLGLRPGLGGALAYSLGGAHNVPFANGLVCIRPPLRFAGMQVATGRPWPPSCSGAFSLDFNAWYAAIGSSAIPPGSQVWIQHFSRDPGSSTAELLTLSDALTFVVCP
jgi:hypothetical protein